MIFDPEPQIHCRHAAGADQRKNLVSTQSAPDHAVVLAISVWGIVGGIGEAKSILHLLADHFAPPHFAGAKAHNIRVEEGPVPAGDR